MYEKQVYHLSSRARGLPHLELMPCEKEDLLRECYTLNILSCAL